MTALLKESLDIYPSAAFSQARSTNIWARSPTMTKAHITLPLWSHTSHLSDSLTGTGQMSMCWGVEEEEAPRKTQAWSGAKRTPGLHQRKDFLSFLVQFASLGSISVPDEDSRWARGWFRHSPARLRRITQRQMMMNMTLHHFWPCLVPLDLLPSNARVTLTPTLARWCHL